MVIFTYAASISRNFNFYLLKIPTFFSFLLFFILFFINYFINTKGYRFITFTPKIAWEDLLRWTIILLGGTLLIRIFVIVEIVRIQDGPLKF